MNPTGNERSLKYPLYNPTSIGATVTDESVPLLSLSGWTTDDSDEQIDVVFRLSLNEYVALATCVDIGRDIAYGENSDYIWWLWSRVIVSTDLCQTIIDCVNNNQDLREAIQALSVGQIDEGIYPDSLALTLFDDSGACNLDVLWGYCSALVDYIDAQNVDFLQQMAESLNVGNGLVDLLSLIPGFQLLPFDEIQGFIEDFGDYNLEAYQASMTTGVRDQIKCDIFCIAQDNDCSLDFSDVFEYFVGKIGGVDVPTAVAIFSEWIYFFVVGSYPSDRIVYIWSSFQLFLTGSGNKFLGLDTYAPYVAKTLSGDPDNDWELLCDDCPVDGECFDFVGSSDGWTEGSSTGEFISAGYRMRTNQQFAIGTLYLALNSGVQITTPVISNMTVDWDSTNCNATNGNIDQNFIEYRYTDATSEQFTMNNFSFPTNQAVQSINYTLPSSDANKVVEAVVIRYRSQLAGNTGYMLITGICFGD